MFECSPSKVTLILSLHGSSMDFAHYLVEVTIWAKLQENAQGGTGLKKQTQNCLIFDLSVTFTLILHWGCLDFSNNVYKVNILVNF
jgi:hypothetical protein